MDENDPEILIAKGFLLGMSAFAHACGLESTPGHVAETMRLIEDIAAGRSTMIMSAAEWAARRPDMPDSMKAKTPFYTNKLIQGERDTARKVVDGLRGTKSAWQD